MGAMQAVTGATLRHGVGGLLSSQRYETRWWDLRLACGHNVDRPAKALPGAAQGRRGFNLMLNPVRDDQLRPAPGRARCDKCVAST